VRGLICRGLRLWTVAGLSAAAAICLLPTAVRAESAPTQTTLNATTRQVSGRTKATLQIAVASDDATAATGAVSIYDSGKLVAGAVLADGTATADVSLPSGTHNLTAVYAGDTTHTSSTSLASAVPAATTTSTPSFTLGLTPISPTSFPMTLTAGAAGTVTVTVTPENNSTLSAPMTVTLSCSGLPDNSSCTFSPTSVQILSTTASSCTTATSSTCPPTATMTLQTQAQGTASNKSPSRPGKGSNVVTWAILLPGMLGLGGLAWSARRKLWLSRMMLIAAIAVFVSLGLSGCNPQYNYYHHAPDANYPTPSGSYTITVTGQSSDGLTATTANTTFVLTVK
jgi:hypothetical protein